MTVRCLVDTNVLVYAARPKNDEPEKSKIANMVIQNERFCLSVQVLQEFYVAAQKTYPGRPSARPLSEREAAEWVGWLEQFCEVVSDVFLVQQAIETARNSAFPIGTRRLSRRRLARLRPCSTAKISTTGSAMARSKSSTRSGSGERCSAKVRHVHPRQR